MKEIFQRLKSSVQQEWATQTYQPYYVKRIHTWTFSYAVYYREEGDPSSGTLLWLAGPLKRKFATDIAAMLNGAYMLGQIQGIGDAEYEYIKASLT